jgi:hypothetical protein
LKILSLYKLNNNLFVVHETDHTVLKTIPIHSKTGTGKLALLFRIKELQEKNEVDHINNVTSMH